MKPAPKEGGKPYRKTVAKLLNELKPNAVLDIACGSGWVKSALNYSATMHGMDFYAVAPDGYDVFRKTDMNTGVPDEFGQFDAAVCCEAMLYLQNPGLFLTSVRRHLRNGGVFIITCPNPTYAGTRLNQLIRGFPRSYSQFRAKCHARGAHALVIARIVSVLVAAGFKRIQGYCRSRCRGR